VIFYVGILASIPTKKKCLADSWGYSPQKIPLQLLWGFSQSQGCGQGFVGTEAPLKWSPIMAEVRVYVITVSRCLRSQMMFNHGNL
jgi:hypothetical protein